MGNFNQWSDNAKILNLAGYFGLLRIYQGACVVNHSDTFDRPLNTITLCETSCPLKTVHFDLNTKFAFSFGKTMS